MKLQWKLALIVAFSTVISIVTVTYIVRFGLVANYKEEAKKDAHQKALLIRHGLLSVMMETNDYKKIEQAIQNLSHDQNFKLKMIRSEHVIKQHGMRRNETPEDEHEKLALKNGAVVELFTEDSYKIIYPFITDERCGACHVGLDDKPIPAGVVNGLATLTFDQTPAKARTSNLIHQITVSLVIVMTIVGFVLLAMAHKTVIKPIKAIAKTIIGFTEDEFDVNLPEYNTTEINIMADEVRRTANKLSEMKTQRENEINLERSRSEEIKKFVLSKAGELGLSGDVELSQVITKLSRVVDESDRASQMARSREFVLQEESRLEIPSDTSLITSISVYLAFVTASDIFKRRSMELVLEEALSNAIIHGNLDVPSDLKERDFDSFNDLIAARCLQEPYASRKVRISHSANRNSAVFVITDEGGGFDWRRRIAQDCDTDAGHGRGLLLMQALASELSFNEKGDEVTLTFDLETPEPYGAKTA
ncbi:MAG: ATP-binding protein [Nitrospinae bacterium]|nr:ATP-binding protein [Nitrospinota bacterium]